MHDDVIKWKHFPRYWFLCGEFTGENDLVNNVEAVELRRHRAHYDVIVMAIAIYKLAFTVKASFGDAICDSPNLTRSRSCCGTRDRHHQ